MLTTEEQVVNKEVVQTADGPVQRVIHEVVVRHDLVRQAGALARMERMSQLVALLVTCVTGLVFGRFVLLMSGASLDNAFARLLLSWSAPLVEPFLGLFGATAQVSGGAVVEFPDLLAMLVYLLAGWLAAWLVRLALAPRDPSGTLYRP